MAIVDVPFTTPASPRAATPARTARPSHLPWRPASRFVAPLTFVAADLLAAGIATLLVWGARTLIWQALPFHQVYWASTAVWVLLRVLVQIEPPYGMAPAEELRHSTMTTVAAAAVHLALLVTVGEVRAPRIFSLLSWALIVPFAWVLRAAVMTVLLRAKLYGMPVVVLGLGDKARLAIREMRANREAGLVPVAVFGDAPEKFGETLEGVPVLGSLDDAITYTFPYRTSRAMLALSRAEANATRFMALNLRFAVRFPRLLVFSELTDFTNLWVYPRPVGAHLALETHHARFTRRNRRIKRAFDLAVGVPVCLVALPIVAVMALLVRLVSPGSSPFFSQTREAIGGGAMRIWKIRSMVPDAEARLATHLAADPAARAEYSRTLKLRNDPRVLPYVGAFMRKLSIDELPQLWSVLTGNLSLVGPRVMPTREIEQYSGTRKAMRREVPPGLTGLWQINHRNNSDLHVREVADTYYVHNWSVWLDLWILLRTVRVVLFGSGAF